LDLDDVVARFTLRTLSHKEWTHVAHLAVGAWHVHTYGAEQALAKLRTSIRQLNDRHGTPNTATSGYHETITAAYVALIDAFLVACEPHTELPDRLRLLLESPMSGNRFLLRFWTQALLMSPAARASWVPPDVAALVLPREALPPRDT
jgi:hypothetical protein